MTKRIGISCLLLFLACPLFAVAAAGSCARLVSSHSSLSAALAEGNLSDAREIGKSLLDATSCEIPEPVWQDLLRLAVLDGDGSLLARLRAQQSPTRRAFQLELAALEVQARRGDPDAATAMDDRLQSSGTDAATDIAAFAYRVRDTDAARASAALRKHVNDAMAPGNSASMRLDAGMFLAAQLLHGQQHERALDIARRNLLTLSVVDADQRALRSHEVLRTIAQAHWQAGRIDAAQKQFQAATHAFAENRTRVLADSRADPARFRWRTGRLFLDYGRFLVEQATACDDPARKQELLASALQVIEQFKQAELEQLLVGLCPTSPSERSSDRTRLPAHALVVLPVRWSNDSQHVLAIHRDGIEVFQPKSTPTEMDALANELREALEQRDPRHREVSVRLYRALIEPLEAIVQQHEIDRIGFVPDASLRQVPLAAVFDGKRYLLERFEITTAPTLEFLLGETTVADRHHLLMASLDEARAGYPALPGVRVETAFLQHRLPSDWTLTRMSNSEFTTGAFQQALASDPAAWIHFATHGEFSAEANRSFLLTYDGQLPTSQLRETLALTNSQANLKLLTLSACQTAAGDDRAALGMAGTLLSTGAENVLASLWFLRDAAAAELIGDFYNSLLKDPTQPASALRAAQLAAIQSTTRNEPDDWAPFLMLGRLQH
jgi:CHAT domain-containing protein